MQPYVPRAPGAWRGTRGRRVLPWRGFGVLALAASLAAAAEVTIEVSADPALPVPNLFRNPGLEQGTTTPVDWGVAASQPDVVDFTYCKSGGYREAYLRVDARASTSNGYLSQPVQVKPETTYRAGIWARLRGGVLVMWLHGYVDGKRYDERAYLTSYHALPLLPDFLEPNWVAGPPPTSWVWVGREFRTWSGQTSINPHFGAYFSRGSMDLDEPFIGLARTALAVTVAGLGLRTVRVLASDGTEVFASPALTATATPYRHVIPDLSTALRYRVMATTADGREASQWYPAD